MMIKKQKTRRSLIFSFGVLALFTGFIAITIGLSLRGIVHSAIRKEAERNAVLWAQDFVTQAHELQLLSDPGEVSPLQLKMIKSAIGSDEIFRFNFFSPTGELKYASYDINFPTTGETAHSSTAQKVYASKQNDVSIKYGKNVPNRPDTFVEAYIPTTLPSGDVFGVVEVYVDVSFLASTLIGLVKSLGAFVVVGSAIAFLIPALILVNRSQQMHSSQAREVWLAAILYHAPFEVVIKDIEGKIRAISRNVIEEFNLTTEDFLGKTTADFLPDEISQIYMRADQELVRTGEATQKEVAETVDGYTRYSLSSKFPLMGSDGQVTGICSITNDITDLKTSEAKFAQAQKMETVGQLTGGVAHDFNNLLSVVSGSLQLLENSERAAERTELIRIALRAIEHGTGLTKQMLALSRRSPLISRPTNLNCSLAEFKKFFIHVLPANIEFFVLPAHQNPNIVVDDGMLQNALLNAALNSKNAMPNGGKLTISADTVPAPVGFPSAFTLEGKCASLTINDNGTGISEEFLESAFEPFYTTQEVGKGSGLGLSMVKGFIEQSNGLIQLESNLDEGTTLKIFLPLTPECVEETKVPSKPLANFQSDKEKDVILVVEDNEQLLNLIALKLERDNFRVVKKSSGDEALKILGDQSDIRLVLSDLVMPGESQGIDVLRKAKSLHHPLPVILMSGYADINKSSEKELELADKFIEKPLALGKLSDDIESLLSN